MKLSVIYSAVCLNLEIENKRLDAVLALNLPILAQKCAERVFDLSATKRELETLYLDRKNQLTRNTESGTI